MSALRAIEQGLIAIGYRPHTIRHRYAFADVLSPEAATRQVELAAFTQVPESFRSAAFGVIEERGRDASVAVAANRALGAPLFLSVGQDTVSVWRVGSAGKPELLDRVPLGALDELFARNADQWNPQAVHRAKSLPPSGSRQIDFIDLGLLPAIEREVQAKLHDVLGDVVHLLLGKNPRPVDERAAFHATFRLLAAKILRDREHPDASSWPRDDVESVLRGIERYYRLPHRAADQVLISRPQLDAAWERLLTAVSLSNISADSLAFVYENTLVTADSRKRFGTHSTPRQVADYVLNRLDLSRFDLGNLRIHEPFAGAGVFLVSALRHLQDLLPADWSAEDRHRFVTSRISGSELDLFACEVATLSLILADYPNANGWKVRSRDLFQSNALAEDVKGATVVLCNPPFEDFTKEEQSTYPESANTSTSKARFALDVALKAQPEALGFVMPVGILRQQQYASLRSRLSETYSNLELVSLPESIFEEAKFPSALVIATEPRLASRTSGTRVVASTVKGSGSKVFLESGRVDAQKSAVRQAGESRLWVGQLDELWEALTYAPKLGASAEVFRGLKWWRQKDGISNEPREGFRLGVYRPEGTLEPFAIHSPPCWLNFDPAMVMFPGPAQRPWHLPKVLTNTQRVSRGPWRLIAAYDTSGLTASQQFFGIWPTTDEFSGMALTAILNGPLANAFVGEHATNQHFTNEMLKELPLPSHLDQAELEHTTTAYSDLLRRQDAGEHVDDGVLEKLLRTIDEIVLDGYRIPPHLRQLLYRYFENYGRPVRHLFTGWNEEGWAGRTDVLGPLEAARNRARLRGRQQAERDRLAAGRELEREEVGHLLGISAGQVDLWTKQNRLLAIPGENGYRYPDIQFLERQPLPGLNEVLAAFPDRNPWSRLNYLMNPDSRLGGARPVDLLRLGKVEAVIQAARAVGEHIGG